MSKFTSACYFLVLVCLFATSVSCQKIYELKRGNFSLKLTDYGATVISVVLPDRHGKLDDVLLGYQTIDEYKNDTTYFGAIVGRVANRIGGAQFTYNGTLYKLVPNDGKNILHGGPKGFSTVVWKVKSYKKNSHITFTYNSPSFEEGFPGKLAVWVTYSLIQRNKLGIVMEATPLTMPTPVNLAFHGYWNLRGHGSGSILSHSIQIFGKAVTPVDGELIPTGQLAPVRGTPYDFQRARAIGSRINKLSGGYDINYALEAGGGRHLRRAAVVRERASGRRMELYTNQPGLQFYTSNLIKEERGKDGAVYSKYGGIVLETQGFPDAVNHPNFPSQIVMPGDKYRHVMLYRFTAH